LSSESGKRRVLVLCALPYTNAVPHVGNIVGSHLPADIFARYCRLKGYETLLIGGADENGTPTEVAALELKVTTQRLTDVFYAVHKRIYDWFEISYDNFSRTSLPVHHKTTQDFFLRIYEKGFVSAGVLRLPYCENDKLFLADRYIQGTCPVCGYGFARGDQCENCATLLEPSQLINPKCKIDGSTPIFRDSENLFLELGKVEGALQTWIKSKGYEDKIFYVWFDAPIGYISSTKEWAQRSGDSEAWRAYWLDPSTTIYNFLGKDNIPFHTIFWPGMLMAHGDFNLPSDVVGLQYCNYEGDKISKSRNWGIFCEKVVESGLAPDIWRYYLTYLIPETKDTEFKWDEFENRVNNELVANIGNFVHRTLTFTSNFLSGVVDSVALGEEDLALQAEVLAEVDEADRALRDVRIRDAMKNILQVATIGNEYFQRSQPWVLIKQDPARCRQVIYSCVSICRILAVLLDPYLPDSSRRIYGFLKLDGRPRWDDVSLPLGRTVIDKP
jgi:methionyl-tRNA synthetase